MRDPERLDLPSASSFEEDALCPGRQQKLAALPPEAFFRTVDDDAERGTRIHKALETDDISGLEEEDQAIYETGRANEFKILERWRGDFRIPENGFERRQSEQRFFLHWPETLQPATSAKLDRHYLTICPEDPLSPKRILVVEHKTLWCRNLTPAERNYQGRLQAVLAAREYDAKHVRVVFNKAMFGRDDTVDYAAKDLDYAEESIYQHLWEARQPGAPRRAGMHCRYCPAQPYCQEAASFSLLPSVVGARAIDEESLMERIDNMPPIDLRLIFERTGIVIKILDAVKRRLKAMSETELTSIGLGKVAGRKLDPITETWKAYSALKDYGINEAELWSALKFSKSELTKAVMRDQGWGKGPTEGFLYAQLLVDCIEKKNAEESLEVRYDY